MIILGTVTTGVSCIYSHAAFVNDIRRTSRSSYQRSSTLATLDPTDEYSLQMNTTALHGLQRCSYQQCKRVAVVGAGQLFYA